MAKQKLSTIYSDSVNKRKTEVHYKHTLTSGKVVNLWLYRCDYDNVWYVGLYISCKGDKAARLWFRDKSAEGYSITGDGSLEALAWAYRKLNWFLQHIPADHYISVDGADYRRHHAYSYLKRKGWQYSEELNYYKGGCMPSVY